MAQQLLFDRTETITHVYKYRINGGGAYMVQESGEVELTFKNGKFMSASYPFYGSAPTRNGWRILAAIEAEIQRIESALSVSPA